MADVAEPESDDAPRVSLLEFTKENVLEWLEATAAAKYLFDYLEHLAAASILVEPHYVDRHYVDDFANYYARAFVAPLSYCARLHFFKARDRTALESALDDFYIGDKVKRAAARSALQDDYLGYVVVRPLSEARVGRTVLKLWSPENRRHYQAVREYVVHVAGLELRVRGLAFQQQDRGITACASIALWSALQQVATLDGNRTPTPAAVTIAAHSPYPPSYGLSGDQMATALSNLGYVAELFGTENPALFRAKIGSCLRSGLPVVLWLGSDGRGGGGGHAVTITGFSEPPSILDVEVDGRATGVRMRDGSLTVVYVHDDNLGSHAHYELIAKPKKAPKGSPPIYLQRGDRSRPAVDWWTVDELPIYAAYVPKPPKLRLPVENLLLDIIELRKLIEKIVAGQPDYSARYATGVSYREELLAIKLDSASVRDFHHRVSLPRFVGVLSVNREGSHLFDAVLDVTELSRKPWQPAILAIVAPGVPLRSSLNADLQALAKSFGSSLIVGPATFEVSSRPSRSAKRSSARQ